MKNAVLFILLGFAVIACNQPSGKDQTASQDKPGMANAEPVKDGVFIHITEAYNDPHKALMPMKMATLMADDKDVIVYLDIHAVELLVKGAKDLTFSGFDSFQTYLKQLIDMNVGIYACPTCLKVAGFEPEDLMEGVQVAQKDKFFNFTKGRIIALDY